MFSNPKVAIPLICTRNEKVPNASSSVLVSYQYLLTSSEQFLKILSRSNGHLLPGHLTPELQAPVESVVCPMTFVSTSLFTPVKCSR